jgi:hypothetical protein
MTHTLRKLWLSMCAVALAFVAAPRAALAQNWSFDARMIALGNPAGSGNLAYDMIDQQRPYAVIPLPFGLVQILKDFDIYNPTSPKFDPIRVVEYAASPIHYIIGRDDSKSSEALFVSDIRNAKLSADLSRYQGFVPVSDLLAEGLAKPLWGGTIKFDKSRNGSYQGLYLGAGPYLSLSNHSTFDAQLLNVLATGVNAPNAVMPITNTDTGQVALAAVVGYRGRFVAGGSPAGRDGLYLAANFNYLRGFKYENDALVVNLTTDRTGLVSPTSGISVLHQEADKGTGYAIDLGAGIVADRLEMGIAANGISNHIVWTGATQTLYALANLQSGNSNFLQGLTTPLPDARVELPVDFRANTTYNGQSWTSIVEAGHGFGGASFRTGIERRLAAIDARAGIRYTFGMWNPSVGVGLNMGPKVSLDVALFGTATNIERKRQTAIAASIRINHGAK